MDVRLRLRYRQQDGACGFEATVQISGGLFGACSARRLPTKCARRVGHKNGNTRQERHPQTKGKLGISRSVRPTWASAGIAVRASAKYLSSTSTPTLA